MASARLLGEMLLRRGRTVSYGPDPSQCADLNLPSAPGPHPVMILLHGGSWRSQYGKRVMRGLVGDLLTRGWATWNVEYRRVGNGGGWPETFLDVASAIDHLPALDAPLDLDRASLLGHPPADTSHCGRPAASACRRERRASSLGSRACACVRSSPKQGSATCRPPRGASPAGRPPR
jgi:hypothetical protein